MNFLPPISFFQEKSKNAGHALFSAGAPEKPEKLSALGVFKTVLTQALEKLSTNAKTETPHQPLAKSPPALHPLQGSQTPLANKTEALSVALLDAQAKPQISLLQAQDTTEESQSGEQQLLPWVPGTPHQEASPALFKRLSAFFNPLRVNREATARSFEGLKTPTGPSSPLVLQSLKAELSGETEEAVSPVLQKQAKAASLLFEGENARPSGSPVGAGVSQAPGTVNIRNIPVGLNPLETHFEDGLETAHSASLKQKADPSYGYMSRDALASTSVAFKPVAAHESVSVQIVTSVLRNVENRTNQFEIRMDPPELGRVEVTLKIDPKGMTHIHLVTENPDVLDMMMRDQRLLMRSLQNAGLEVLNDGMTFSLEQRDTAKDHGFDSSSGDVSQDATGAGEAPSGRLGEDTFEQSQTRVRVGAFLEGRLNIKV